MRIFLGGATVRSPARVADSVSTVERLKADYFFQIAQFAFGAPHLQAFAVTADGDPGGVVAAILQTPQPLNNDRDNLLLTDVSHDSAHIWLLLFPAEGRCKWTLRPPLQTTASSAGRVMKDFYKGKNSFLFRPRAI